MADEIWMTPIRVREGVIVSGGMRALAASELGQPVEIEDEKGRRRVYLVRTGGRFTAFEAPPSFEVAPRESQQEVEDAESV
jgi:hypothetical protein